MGPVAELCFRATVDLLALAALTVGLYSRRRPEHELAMVFSCFNVGLFAALTQITSGSFPAGVGFGLFGVLSIIRLRSQTYSNADIGYFFVCLVLALVTGLPERGLALIPVLSVALVLTVYVADHPRLHLVKAQSRVVLDRAYPEGHELVAAASAAVGAPVLSLRIQEIDQVRDTTSVVVTYATGTAGRAGSPVPGWSRAAAD